MERWIIRRVNGSSQEEIGSLPRHMNEQEVERALQRLACMHLSPDEILAASLRKGAKGRVTLLDRVGHGRPICVGENPFYTAECASFLG